MPFDGGDHKNLIRQISNGEYKEPTQSSGTAKNLFIVFCITNLHVSDNSMFKFHLLSQRCFYCLSLLLNCVNSIYPVEYEYIYFLL